MKPLQLADAIEQRRLVRFSRLFEKAVVRGYVLAVGPRFFLCSVVSDRIWFDGFECFRISDVRKLRLDPYATFTEAALRKRGERTPKPPKVNIASIEELLLSASRAFPLLTIHRERINPDVCYIGRIVEIEHGRLSLLGISPSATWDAAPNNYRLKDITRVGFGADYESALHLVGGSPAALTRPVDRATGSGRKSRGESPTARLRQRS